MDIRQLSATTFPYRDEPLETALSAFAGIGFKKVDLLGRAPHFSPDPAELDLPALKAQVESHGLRVANLASYCGNFVEGDDAEKEAELGRLQRTIDAAVFLGARSIRVFRGGELDDARNVPLIAPWFRRAADYAEEKQIGMGIENHGGGISNDPAVFHQLCETVGSSYFGMLYDPCNCHTHGGNYREMLTVMRDYLIHVHLKDGTAEPRSHQTTMLGEGDIDFPWVLAQLRDIGYTGDITVEYEHIHIPPAEGLKTWLTYLTEL